MKGLHTKAPRWESQLGKCQVHNKCYGLQWYGRWDRNRSAHVNRKRTFDPRNFLHRRSNYKHLADSYCRMHFHRWSGKERNSSEVLRISACRDHLPLEWQTAANLDDLQQGPRTLAHRSVDAGRPTGFRDRSRSEAGSQCASPYGSQCKGNDYHGCAS